MGCSGRTSLMPTAKTPYLEAYDWDSEWVNYTTSQHCERSSGSEWLSIDVSDYRAVGIFHGTGSQIGRRVCQRFVLYRAISGFVDSRHAHDNTSTIALCQIPPHFRYRTCSFFPSHAPHSLPLFTTHPNTLSH